MRPSERIREHRLALMTTHRWVQRQPMDLDEGCLVRRVVGDERGRWERRYEGFAHDEVRIVHRALLELHPDAATLVDSIWWNDHVAGSVDEVLEVLERAEKLALIDEAKADEVAHPGRTT